MKLDISYTDHSHIIGRGGLTIKQVMEETGCHIHFPDSNRSNLTEKNNQVSISGEMAFVEKARAKLRVSSSWCTIVVARKLNFLMFCHLELPCDKPSLL